EAELEYLVGQQSSGLLFGSYINDSEIDPHSVQDPFGADRWIARGLQDFYLPFGWRAKSNFTFISDNRYLRDFEDLRYQKRDRYLESNAFLFNQFGVGDRFGFVLAAQVADDLQNPDDLDRDPYLLQRVPNLELKMLPQPLGLDVPVANRLVPSLDVQYTFFGQLNNPDESFPTGAPFTDSRVPLDGDLLFYDVGIDAVQDGREGKILDAHRDDFVNGGGPEGDGKFQEGEPLADSGNRLLVTPRLAVPFRIGNHVEVYPEVGYRQALYKTREHGTAGWGSITALADVRTRLRRSYGTNVVHLLEPHLDYALVARSDIESEPLFAPYTAVPQIRLRQLTLENVTRDSSDRPRKFNGFTIGVSNRFYREGTGSRPARMVADFDAGLLFDFSKNGKIGNLVIDGRGSPVPGTVLKVNFGMDLDGFVLEDLLVEGAWRGEKLGAALSYRYLERVPQFFEDFKQDPDRFDDFDGSFDRINQADLSLTYRFTRNWSARYRVAYSLEKSILLTNSAAIEYLSKCECWAAGITVAQDRQLGYQIGILYRIVGLGNDPTAGRLGLSSFGLVGGF
ncbi:MAG: LPS assembly protein LptD, partial [Myxococcota bacterium]